MRNVAFAAVLLAAACARPPVVAAPPGDEELAAERLVARAGCVRCHDAPAATAPHLQPLPGPALATAAAWRAPDGGEAFLQRHHGGDDAAALAAWVRSLAAPELALQPAAVSPAQTERGATLWRELACGACHPASALEGLAQRTDVDHVAAFLREPGAHRPGVWHDFGLTADAARALAAWLLRAQGDAAATAPVPGFAYECFERQVDSARLPDLTGLQPVARGVATALDASVGTRADHFVLRFQTTLQVPAAGEWTFTTGSDDSSWLWIDDQQVVANEALAPHRRARGTIRLTAGPHALRVVYSEAAGQQTLEVLWRGPGVAEQPIPATAASVQERALVPPPVLPMPAAERVAAGRAAAAARRCTACHAVEAASLPPASAPASAPARPFLQLGGGECPQQPGAAAIAAAARRAVAGPVAADLRLRADLQHDGCLACHARDGRGGLPPPVRTGLAEVEDLGDEGRLPPDLTAVGHRLRQTWLANRLAGGEPARAYLKVRMPKLTAERAAAYAAAFAAVDGRPGDDDEPPFTVAAAELGQRLVGTGGKNCITCHPVGNARSLGPQGMDLLRQHERLRPAWFREWLLRPTAHRPATRMPTLWVGGETDRQEVDAVRAWASLGAAAPLPPGVAAPAGLVLEPRDRPVLHGAFLHGLSARCVAVGSPLRTHYAYDVEHARLAWLWRGAFVDAAGTWSGRAGQLLRPLGSDHVVLDDLELADDRGATARSVRGRLVAADGYPIWRVVVGAAEFEDELRPRLTAGGSELVRTLRVRQGTVRIRPGAAAGNVRLTGLDGPTERTAGQAVELVYAW